MDFKRNGTQRSGKGSADWFTGTVRIDPLFECSIRGVLLAAALPWSRAPGPRGTHIRSARH